MPHSTTTERLRVHLKRLRLSDTITGLAGVVMVIALFVAPWHVDIGGEDKSALQSPNAFLGLLILMFTVFVIALIVLERLLDAAPELPGGFPQVVLYLCMGIMFLTLLKLYLETSDLGWGALMVLLLAGVMLWGSVLIYRAGGKDEDEVFEDWS